MTGPRAFGRRALLIAALVLAPLSAAAQCVNTSTPGCGVYAGCFAKLCDCAASPYEYFIGYGKKYCEAFLNLPGLSDAGRRWRDTTLRCLQETIVPQLPSDSSSSTCDCKVMQVKAFDSHVACYTEPGASICALPASDWAKILAATDPVKGLADQKNRKQMLEVASICLPHVAGDVRKHVMDVIKLLQ